jgi:hypothetical protein
MVGSVRFGMADVEDEIFTVDEFAAPLGGRQRGHNLSLPIRLWR